jgi:hypothetical protein
MNLNSNLEKNFKLQGFGVYLIKGRIEGDRIKSPKILYKSSIVEYSNAINDVTGEESLKFKIFVPSKCRGKSFYYDYKKKRFICEASLVSCID